MITEQQKRAIYSDEKLLLVKAGAGTGKTEVLTRRIIRLLEDNTELSLADMAVITFTNKATQSLLARLKRYLYQRWKRSNPLEQQRFRYELERLNSCQISTIHQFCRSVLDLAGPIGDVDFSYSPMYLVSNRPLRLALEKTVETFIRERELAGESIQHLKIMPTHKLMEILLDAYDMLQAKNIDIMKICAKSEDALVFEDLQPRALKSEFIILLQKLQNLHSDYQTNTLSVDQLLEYCYKVLERNDDVRDQVRHKYKYLFVDEFQDTSSFQSRIIKLICNGAPGSPSLFVVGDSKQSIYQFRGANLKAYSKFEHLIKRHGEVLILNINFRSTASIVNYINTTFGQIACDYPELNFRPDPLQPPFNSDLIGNIQQPFKWLSRQEGASQSETVARFIKEQIDEGIPPENFALLFRRNRPMLEYADQLAQLSIPYQLIGPGDFYNQREIIDTYKLVNWLIDQRDLLKDEALETIFIEGDRQLLASLVAVFNEIQHKYLTPAQSLDLIYRFTKVRERIIKVNPQSAANLNYLKSVIRQRNLRENQTLSEFVKWLNLMIATHQEEDEADLPKGSLSNTVTLITIHKAKGLEFPIVILPELDEALGQSTLNPPVVLNQDSGLELSYRKYYDNRKIFYKTSFYDQSVKDYQNELYSEELRVLYVALTRAKEKLVFIGSDDCPKNKTCFQNWLID